MCLGLGAAGAHVVVAARTEEDNSAGTRFEKYGSGTIVDTAAQINDLGGVAFPVRCDITQAEDISHLIDAALERFRRIDIVISNAGVDCESPVADLDVDLLDRCLAVNIRGPLLLCKYALPSMIAHGDGGSIFCVTSGSANAYRVGRVGYSMSKAALERTFFSLAEEVRPHNIAVNVLGPGRVDTWMNRNGDWPGTEQIPMVPPDEIIPSAVWLAGQTAKTLTGTLVDRADFGKTWGPIPA
jgi:NAD(P)-dependent dehydrogenase (short-subunit alcohol dehydrogenase family)